MDSQNLNLNDPLWRVQNLYLIRSKDRTLQRLKFNNVQNRIVGVISDRLSKGLPIRHYDLKFRQGGISTFWVLFYLDNTIFTPNTISVIQSVTQESNKHIWDIARLAYETMPTALRPRSNQDSATTLAFDETKSKIMVTLKVLSTTLHNLHLSEYPLCDSKDIEQTLAAVPPGANVTLEGVSNGMNHAYDKWQGTDNYTRLFHPWFLQEEYRIESLNPVKWTEDELKLKSYAMREYQAELTDDQILFRRDKQNDLKQLFDQEMAESPETCFISSGNAYFNNKKIKILKEEAKEHQRLYPPKRSGDWHEVNDMGTGWEMWEEPALHHIYAAGADVAEGVDGDYSVLSIFCVTCRKQAFRYRARVNVSHFYKVCDEWGRKYNNALLAPEMNNHGHAIILGLREDCRYPNLFYHESNRIPPITGKHTEAPRKFGWDTKEDSKKTMLDQIQYALEGEFLADESNFEPAFTVLDTWFLSECFTFINNEGKLEAASGKHDDLVMAWAIAYQMFRRLGSRSKTFQEGSITFGPKLDSSSLFKS